MEIINQIHLKVSKMNLSPAESFEVSSLVGQAFRAGMADAADPLAGYSNLTAAISAKEPIDWERLDGLNVKCVNPDVGTLRGVLMRNGRNLDTSDAWWGEEATASYINALYDGWSGKDGWSLYVEGDIPLRRKTADQLEVGTYFRGVEGGALMYVGAGHQRGLKAVYRSPEMFVSPLPAEKWVVIEECGTFQKPDGK